MEDVSLGLTWSVRPSGGRTTATTVHSPLLGVKPRPRSWGAAWTPVTRPPEPSFTMTIENPQPYLDASAELSARQQALLALCNAHWITIGDTSTATGEDAGEYFDRLALTSTGSEDPERIPAVAEPSRYCALTSHDDTFFVIASFDSLEAAQSRAAEYMADDVFTEQPVAVIDLDTGQRWDAIPTAAWTEPSAPAAARARKPTYGASLPNRHLDISVHSTLQERMDHTDSDSFPTGYRPDNFMGALVAALVERFDDAFTPANVASAIAARLGDGDYNAAEDFVWQQLGPVLDLVENSIEDQLHIQTLPPAAPRDFSADVAVRQIAGPSPTHQELWQLARTEGFEHGEALLQIKPDPSMPYCAVIYSTLGMEQMHIGAFKAVSRNGVPVLTLDVFTESEGPLIATCPPSLIDTVPPVDTDPHSFSAKWRQRCRDFDVMRRVAGGDPAKQQTLKDMSDSGRIVFSRIG